MAAQATSATLAWFWTEVVDVVVAEHGFDGARVGYIERAAGLARLLQARRAPADVARRNGRNPVSQREVLSLKTVCVREPEPNCERAESSQWSCGRRGLYTADDISTGDPHRLSQAGRTVAVADVRRELYRGSMATIWATIFRYTRLTVRCGFAGLLPY
jgi:hypothetical protein